MKKRNYIFNIQPYMMRSSSRWCVAPLPALTFECARRGSFLRIYSLAIAWCVFCIRFNLEMETLITRK